ncbi:hypothetical protein J5N97_007896 [Dioscorea zingiberensis]|uniref:WRKY domain-containing protein n=1 Tax=Dioscorea zingiberensis TaxID=325984 RepID=A0A9D5DD97_9LILI|nr:hypothetical protein J5N97_007896 [Dioscorea zingiberensis]
MVDDKPAAGAPNPQPPEPVKATPDKVSPPAPNPKKESDRKPSGDPTLPEDVAPVSSASSGGDGRSFQQLLAGAMAVPVVAVPCFIAPAALLESPGFTGQFAMTHQAVLATVTAQAQMQLQAAYPSSSSELTTASFPQPMLSAISPVPLQQRAPEATENNVNPPEADQPPTSEQKTPSARIIVKAASSDGYNWRKYGQKQVKSSDRSRSYYKCTNTDCSAKKKVEHCQDGRITEITYRNVHNHDPPQKYRCSKERGSQSVGPSGENENIDPPAGELNETDLTASKVEQISGNETPEQQLHCSSDCEEDVAIKAEEDIISEPDAKRRLTESIVPYSPPVLKTVKEPKVVVQAASDAGLVSDGYRWRKYGQKIVKGNPNPRSYYRCTHSGCPVRKHVERASEDAKAVVITYEGKHNHDMPTPKNGSDTTASVTISGTAATAAGHLHSSDSVSDQKPSTDSLQDVDGEMTGDKALDLGGEKALESAETLLSIGYNKTSGDGVGETGSGSSIQLPVFNDNHAAVPVQNS